MGLTLLAQAHLPLHYQVEAFQTATFLINKLPTPVLKGETPYYILFKHKPNYEELKVFGCATYPCLRPYQQRKFNFHSTKCVFLGYSPSHKGYKCMTPTGKIIISRHIVFYEGEFPFSKGFLNKKQSEAQMQEVAVPRGLIQNQFQQFTDPNLVIADTANFDPHNSQQSLNDNSENNTSANSKEICAQSDNDEVNNHTRSPLQNDSSQQEQQHSLKQAQQLPMVTYRKSGIQKPKIPYVGTTNVNEGDEPTNVSEALQCPQWKQAMQS